MPVQYAITAAVFVATVGFGFYVRRKFRDAAARLDAILADLHDVWPTDDDVYDHERSGL